MFLRRAFVEGSHLPTRFPLRSRSHPALTFRLVSSAPHPIEHHARGPSNERTSQVHDRTPTGTFVEELERFHAVVCTREETPRPAFDHLQRYIMALPDPSFTLRGSSRELLEEALLHLCRSSSPHDHAILKDGLFMVAHFLDVGAEDYAIDVFNRLVNKGTLNNALSWLSVTGRKDSIGIGYASDLAHWHCLLEVAASKRDEYLLANVLKKMNTLGVVPTVETGSLIVAAIFRPVSPHATRPLPAHGMMKHTINLFHATGVPYDRDTVRIIMEGYSKAGEDDTGQRVELLYTSTLAAPGSRLTEARMNEGLSSAASRCKRKQVLRQLRRYQDLGLQPSEDTLFAVLGDDAKIDDYEYWRKTLSISGGSRAAAKVMGNVLAGGGPPSRIVQFYKLERTRGYGVSPDMLHFAIQALLSSNLAGPSEGALETAFAFYHAFVRDVTSNSSEENPAVREHPRPRTYQILLRTLTCSHGAESLPLAVSLVDDMRRFQVRLDAQTTTSVIILIMNACPTPEEAFETYRLLGQPPDQHDTPNLNVEGYDAILAAFCSLKTWPEGIPSTKLFFQIVADMRKHGLALNHKAYTIIIGRLSALATTAASAAAADNSNLRRQIARTIARVHNHLTVNASFTPDVALWNQLMDAYQRAGCFTEAYRIWEKLFASRTFDNVSVSIIIDACAFNRAYNVAVRVFTGLLESEHPLTVRNWNTFLECLCRLDRIDEAMKVLCLEMSGREDGIAPDKESVRILLKFATKHKQEAEIRSKLKRFVPKLYYSLQSEMR
ncbi:hypothetical protein V8D89_012381 [Ganoderma adspersum]